jgi:hypothetical protein
MDVSSGPIARQVREPIPTAPGDVDRQHASLVVENDAAAHFPSRARRSIDRLVLISREQARAGFADEVERDHVRFG